MIIKLGDDGYCGDCGEILEGDGYIVSIRSIDPFFWFFLGNVSL